MTVPVLPPDPDADAPEWWQRASTYRRLPILLLIVVVAIFLAAESRSSPPALTTNCHTPAFALSTYDPQQHEQVSYSMTGVPGHTYVLVAVGPLIESPTEATLTGPVTMPSDCTASDTFGVLLAPGDYGVEMRESAGEGAVSAKHKFVVTARPS